jgi:hypothetical protein
MRKIMLVLFATAALVSASHAQSDLSQPGTPPAVEQSTGWDSYYDYGSFDLYCDYFAPDENEAVKGDGGVSDEYNPCAEVLKGAQEKS